MAGELAAAAGIAERKMAAEYLRELERIGMLKSHKAGRENLYLNFKLFELLAA
jgi:hypothetical protein